MLNLEGKRALIFGVASESSLAWAISNWLIKAGSTCVLSYQQRFKSRIIQLTKDVEGIEALEVCDVSKEDEVKDLFNRVSGKFDMIVHAIGYSPASALSKPVIFTSEEDYNTTMVVSAYSLQRIARHSLKRLNQNSAIVTLTYLGATSVVPGYRIMGTAKAALESLVRELSPILGDAGHRINAISAGPVKTLAASGVPGFDDILEYMEKSAPMRKNIDQDDVAKTALFLLSGLSSGITGQTIFVDNGYNIIGVPPHLNELNQ